MGLPTISVFESIEYSENLITNDKQNRDCFPEYSIFVLEKISYYIEHQPSHLPSHAPHTVLRNVWQYSLSCT